MGKKRHLPICARVIGDLERTNYKKIDVSDAVGPEKQ